MYNVLEKLRTGETLTVKEKTITFIVTPDGMLRPIGNTNRGNRAITGI